MTPEELQELIDLGHEQASVEFKGPCARENKHALARILRSMMAMANRRDGGVVVIGVDETESGLNATGMSPKDAASWTRDALGTMVAEFVEPPVEFLVEPVNLGGKTFVVISVFEFRDVPVLARKTLTVDGKAALPEGACLVRSRGKPESAEVSSYAEMRELIDLATEKGVRRFFQVLRASQSDKNSERLDDAELFKQQADELL